MVAVVDTRPLERSSRNGIVGPIHLGFIVAAVFNVNKHAKQWTLSISNVLGFPYSKPWNRSSTIAFPTQPQCVWRGRRRGRRLAESPTPLDVKAF